MSTAPLSPLPPKRNIDASRVVGDNVASPPRASRLFFSDRRDPKRRAIEHSSPAKGCRSPKAAAAAKGKMLTVADKGKEAVAVAKRNTPATAAKEKMPAAADKGEMPTAAE